MAVIDRRQEVGDALLLRIRSEFQEMPGLHLTVRQASRLWGLHPDTCQTALDRLVEVNHLRRTPEGAYALTQSSLMACAWHRRD